MTPKKDVNKIEVDEKEVVQIFLLLEKLNSFFHQPLNYQDAEDVKAFIEADVYNMISKSYYDVVWSWLPPHIQREMEER